MSAPDTDEVTLPVKRTDGETLEARLTDNAYHNILRARYLQKDANGDLVETQEELSFAGFDGAVILTPHQEIVEHSLGEIRDALGERPIVVDPHAVFRHEGKRSRHEHEYVTL